MAGSARPVVFVSHDRIGPSMAGPGIRYWELARVVARHCPVRVAAPVGSRPPDDGPDLVCDDPSRLETLWPLIQPARALVAPAPLLDDLPALAALRLPLAIDLYDPAILEDLERARQDPRLIPPVAEWRQRWLSLFQAGDFFLCASERQRDLWLGMLLLAGRVNRWTYGHDPTLRRLIDVVPMGLPATPPPRGGGLKGRQPGIAPTDRVVLWGGGLWDWLDPLTLVRAVPQVVARHPTLRVVFLGTRHPNPRVSPMALSSRRCGLWPAISGFWTGMLLNECPTPNGRGCWVRPMLGSRSIRRPLRPTTPTGCGSWTISGRVCRWW